MRKLSDEKILDLIRSVHEPDNRDALTYLYREYFASVQKLVVNNNGSVDDAKDIFQDGMLAFYNQVRQQQLNLNCSIKTYLYSICRHQWLSALRKRKVNLEINDHEPYVEKIPGIERAIFADEREVLIASMLDQIGEACKKILLYFYIDRYSMNQIMELMQLSSVPVTRNKKMHCLNKLKKLVFENPVYKNNLRD